MDTHRTGIDTHYTHERLRIMQVKGNHPLAEIIAKKLFGINVVPPQERDKMVQAAVHAAVDYHESRTVNVKRFPSSMHDLQRQYNLSYNQAARFRELITSGPVVIILQEPMKGSK